MHVVAHHLELPLGVCAVCKVVHVSMCVWGHGCVAMGNDLRTMLHTPTYMHTHIDVHIP